MKGIRIAYWTNTILSGFVALLVSSFFAVGGIAENMSGKTFVAPGFFMVIPIWLVGVLIGRFIFTKDDSKLFLLLSLVITWISIPLGINLGDLLVH